MVVTETQPESAIRMYNARAPTYDNSWHPDYSRRFIALIPLKAGDRVLSLCCGTGLDVFLAAEKVGEDGEVIGVDISEGMLQVALEKQTKSPALGSRVRFLRQDVANLDGLPEVVKGSFDVST